MTTSHCITMVKIDIYHCILNIFLLLREFHGILGLTGNSDFLNIFSPHSYCVLCKTVFNSIGFFWDWDLSNIDFVLSLFRSECFLHITPVRSFSLKYMSKIFFKVKQCLANLEYVSWYILTFPFLGNITSKEIISLSSTVHFRSFFWWHVWQVNVSNKSIPKKWTVLLA